MLSPPSTYYGTFDLIKNQIFYLHTFKIYFMKGDDQLGRYFTENYYSINLYTAYTYHFYWYTELQGNRIEEGMEAII